MNTSIRATLKSKGCSDEDVNLLDALVRRVGLLDEKALKDLIDRYGPQILGEIVWLFPPPK